MASMPFFKPRPAAQLTFYQQPQKVSKKGRSPARLYSLCVSTNTGRENAFPTRPSLRLHPCNRPSVSLRCSGSLESRNGCFVVRAYEKCTIDSIQEAGSNKLSIPLKLATFLSDRREETSLKSSTPCPDVPVWTSDKPKKNMENWSREKPKAATASPKKVESRNELHNMQSVFSFHTTIYRQIITTVFFD